MLEAFQHCCVSNVEACQTQINEALIVKREIRSTHENQVSFSADEVFCFLFSSKSS